MKKIFVLFAVLFSFSAAFAFGGGDKVINKNQLPAQAQSFLNEHFAGSKISYAKQDTDFLQRNYEVMLPTAQSLSLRAKAHGKRLTAVTARSPQR